MATVSIVPVTYVEVGEGIAVDRTRTHAYRWKKGRDDEDAGDWVEVTSPPGVPRVLDCRQVDGESDRRATDETFYTIQWSHLADDPPQTVSAQELNDGVCWGRWPGLGITSRRSKDFWADVVKGQVGRGGLWGVSVRRSQRTTGWHQVGAAGQWRYFLRDGTVVGESSATEPCPIDGYHFPREHQRAWERGRLAEVGGAADLAPYWEELSSLVEYCLDSDPRGILLLMVGAASRSLISTHLPAKTSVFGVGGSGAGKTTRMNFARGIDGPCPADAEADVMLENPTVNGVETRLGPLHDLPMFADDLHEHPDDSPHRTAQRREIVGEIVYAAFNGGEMRPRATREARAKISARVGGIPFLSAEQVPPQNPSALRRMIYLACEQGELQRDVFFPKYEQMQHYLTLAGRGIILKMTRMLNSDDGADRLARIAKWEAGRVEIIYQELRKQRADAPDEFVRSLAQNYARPLTGLWLMARAASNVKPGEDTAFADTLLGYVFDLAAAQLDLMAAGGPSQVNREWVTEIIRAALGQGRAHVLDMEGARLTDAPISLTRLGYRGDLPMGEELGNLHVERETFYLLPDETHALLRRAALSERRCWTWTGSTLPGFLVSLGLAMPEATGRACTRVRIAGQRDRRIAVPFAYLFSGDNPDDDGMRESTSNSGPSGPSGPSPSPDRMDSGLETCVPGTAAQDQAVPPAVPPAAITRESEPGTAPGTAPQQAAVPGSDAAEPNTSGVARCGTAGTAGTAPRARLAQEEIDAARSRRQLTAKDGYSVDPPDKDLPCSKGGRHLWGVAANGYAFACRKCQPALVARR